MSALPVEVSVEDGVATILLNRPQAANALDLPAAHAFRAAVDRCEADDVRVVLILGAGARFCAGGDVSTFLANDDPAAYLEELAGLLETDLRRLEGLSKPVVAGVHGAVAGGGLGFVLHADLVVAAESTKFTMAYSGIGLTPDMGVSYLLPRIVGLRRALEFTLSRRTLVAPDAREWGLVTEVVPDDEAADRARALAREIADGPAHALGQARRLFRAAHEASRDRHGRDEIATISAAVATPEAAALIQRFLDR